MKILVAGGTGRIGRAVVVALHATGHHAVAGTPSSGVDTVSGVGLAAAAHGAGAVLDVTDCPAGTEETVAAFFRASTRNLLIAETQTGVGHHVVLSIVGADRVTGHGYYRAKAAQEQAVREGAVPFTIVRTTQLFESLSSAIRSSTDDDELRLPPIPVQPIALADLVPELAGIVVGPPRNGTIELAGPAPVTLDDLARRLLEARGDQRKVITDPAVRPSFGLRVDEEALPPGPAARLAPTDLEGWLRTT